MDAALQPASDDRPKTIAIHVLQLLRARISYTQHARDIGETEIVAHIRQLLLSPKIEMRRVSAEFCRDISNQYPWYNQGRSAIDNFPSLVINESDEQVKDTSDDFLLHYIKYVNAFLKSFFYSDHFEDLLGMGIYEQYLSLLPHPDRNVKFALTIGVISIV
eukprot:jgi/Hompol1/4124/HPOL_006955-RA